MKKNFLLLSTLLIAVTFIFSSGCENSTEPGETETEQDSTGGPGPVVRKPNIYLYPTEVCSISVHIEFPSGGRIIESEPLYNNGWLVKADPSGRINDKYDYLFYEAECPEVYQYDHGWVVNKDSLLEFFTKNLEAAGFNGKETNDFIEYWIPKLVDYQYYVIYPQFAKEIEKIIQLKFSMQPESLLRLFYVIEGTNNKRNISAPPSIPSFNRKGFAVTEWGVILK